jgi:hypothetical protein
MSGLLFNLIACLQWEAQSNRGDSLMSVVPSINVLAITL